MSNRAIQHKELSLLLTKASNGLDLSDRYLSRGSAHIIGITGSAAAGKSTLTDKLIKVFRQDAKSVVILAIDPSSPESGGAFLGDRIRMRAHFEDENVFIRSLSSRGAKDSSVLNLDRLVNVASFFADVVLVESPGAGQADLGIKNSVDTFVFLPDFKADIINLMKSGIHEYAHIMVLNFRNEASDEEVKFSNMLSGLCGEFQDGWRQLVFEVNALTGKGVDKLVREGIYEHNVFIRPL